MHVLEKKRYKDRDKYRGCRRYIDIRQGLRQPLTDDVITGPVVRREAVDRTFFAAR